MVIQVVSLLEHEGANSAIKFANGTSKFSFYYANLEETKKVMETGELPNGSSYYNEILTTDQVQDYYDKVAPHMLIFYNDNLISILPTAQDSDK